MCSPCCLRFIASAMEVQFALSSFGIPRKTLPIGILGKINTEDHKDYLNSRRMEESPDLVPSKGDIHSRNLGPPMTDLVSSSTVKLVDAAPVSLETPQSPPTDAGPVSPSRCLPTDNDVLFGRGRVKEHPGNIILHHLIGARTDRYEAAEKWEKTVIAEEIVAIIRERSGRFLKQEKGSPGKWVSVDIEVAREKVSHTFRSARPKSMIAQSAKKRMVSTENAKRMQHSAGVFCLKI